MTRKDYIVIAGALAEAYRNAKHSANFDKAAGDQLNGIWSAAASVAGALSADNSRFDREHFLAVVRGEKALNSRPAR